MLMRMLVHVVVTAIAVLLIAQFVPNIVVSSFYTALIVAVVWGIIGLTIRPILGILTLPINIITFGLFSFILNALLFWLLATFIKGFEVHGFIPALEGSAILSVVSWLLHKAVRRA
jgi:putative membrane protein